MDTQRTSQSAARAAGDTSRGDPGWSRTPALFMFGDSSGDSSRSARAFAAGQQYIVCTVIIDPLEMFRVDSEIARLKTKHFEKIDPLRVEFHGRALRNFIGEHTHGKQLIEDKFSRICDDLVEIVCGMKAQVNMVVLDKVSTSENYDHTIIERKSWATAASMFAQVVNTTADPMLGIPILDKYDRTCVSTITEAFAQALEPFPANSKDPGSVVLPRPMFIPSASSNLLQLVDMTAHIAARHHRRGDEENFERWYELLDAKFGRVAQLRA